MSDKLHEIISKSYGAKFNFVYGDIKKELTLTRLSALELVEIEDEYGISIHNFAEKILEKLATNATLIGWKLLVEKDEFNNDISVFRKCLDANQINELSEAVFSAFTNGMPEEKNAQRPAKKMK